MNNPFKSVISNEYYRNSTRIKWIVLSVAALISIASIYYTNFLVNNLKERERRFIELYATSLESLQQNLSC